MIGSESSPGLKYELNYGMIGNRGDEMRLDKYLKVARILKRRTVSKGPGGSSARAVNGKVAKPASEVQVGDLITVIFGQRQLIRCA